MQDLSSLAKDSLWVTSQAGGNMSSGRPAAMTAPGTDPVDPLPPAKEQGDPKVTPSNSTQIKPGTDGKSKPRNGYNPGPPAWSKTS